MSIYYIGGFPPPYGGVTTKNNNLYTALSENIEIHKIDFNEIKRKNIILALKLIAVLMNKKNKFIVGTAGKKTRKNLCKLMYIVNRPAMRNSIIFLMGGTAANDIANDQEYQRYISEFKCVYAETNGMVKTLKAAGLKNAGYYPNCRFKPYHVKHNDKHNNSQLKCVFFSRISLEKGAGIVLETASHNPQISFAFYGPIVDGYENEFLAQINNLFNAHYYGVFNGSKDDVYEELGKFDVLLFPTTYDIEGVPGILVEAKISGITCIVSDKSFNAELIQDGKEGIVLPQNTSEELSKAIRSLNDDREKLQILQNNNKASSAHYYIENYIDEIMNEINMG